MDKTLQPNSRYCFVCGLANEHGLHLRFYNSGEGRVEAECTIPEHFQGYPGVAHGGVVAAILDEAAGRSHMIKNPQEPNPETRFMVTARLDIRYRRTVPVGKPLRVVGEAVKDKSRAASARAYLYSIDGALLAEAQALLIDIPDNFLTVSDPRELGWKIYPEEKG